MPAGQAPGSIGVDALAAGGAVEGGGAAEGDDAAVEALLLAARLDGSLELP